LPPWSPDLTPIEEMFSKLRVCPISGVMPQYDSGTQAPRLRAGDV
jgi:hypothetical protein